MDAGSGSLIAWSSWRSSRSSVPCAGNAGTPSSRESFGAEYERAVAHEGDVRRGESDLLARRERRAKLDIRPLSPSSRDSYLQSWEQTQARFVDNPAGALSQATPSSPR